MVPTIFNPIRWALISALFRKEALKILKELRLGVY
jgi:hypothetical protein